MARGYERFEWSVLDWNEPSIGFYRSDRCSAHGRMDGLPAHWRGTAQPCGQLACQRSVIGIDLTVHTPSHCPYPWLTMSDSRAGRPGAGSLPDGSRAPSGRHRPADRDSVTAEPCAAPDRSPFIRGESRRISRQREIAHSSSTSLCHLGGEGVPDRRRARDSGLRGSPAARCGCLPVGAAYGHGRPRSPLGLHPRRDRGSAHRGRRGLRDPAAAGRARLGAQLCLPPDRRLAARSPSRPRPPTAAPRSATPSPGRCSPHWPARSTPRSPRTVRSPSACTSSAARDPGRREERGRAGVTRARTQAAAEWRPSTTIPEQQARPHPVGVDDHGGRLDAAEQAERADHMEQSEQPAGSRRSEHDAPDAEQAAAPAALPRPARPQRRAGDVLRAAQAARRLPGARGAAQPAGPDASPARRAPGPPLPQPRRAAGRPDPGRHHRSDQVGRPLRPGPRRGVLHVRDPDGRRRDQAALPRQGLGGPRPAPAPGAAARR